MFYVQVYICHILQLLLTFIKRHRIQFEINAVMKYLTCLLTSPVNSGIYLNIFQNMDHSSAAIFLDRQTYTLNFSLLCRAGDLQIVYKTRFIFSVQIPE